MPGGVGSPDFCLVLMSRDSGSGTGSGDGIGSCENCMDFGFGSGFASIGEKTGAGAVGWLGLFGGSWMEGSFL